QNTFFSLTDLIFTVTPPRRGLPQRPCFFTCSATVRNSPRGFPDKIARLAHGRMLLLLLVSLLGSLILPVASRWLGRGAGLLMSTLPFGLLAAFVATAPVVERGWVQGEGIQWAPTL